MKTWRLVLLLVLTLLLPVRGAVAAAMLCPPGHHGQAVAQAPMVDHAHHAAEGLHAQHAHDMQAGHQGTDSPAHSDTCHVCASFCSMTPLLSAMPVVQQPLEVATLHFPEWAAAAPLFLSDGQERPPRRF